MTVASGVWTDEKATRVATFAAVLATMSLLCGPIFGGALLDSLHHSLGLPLAVGRWASVPLSMLAGVPAFTLATLSMSRARSTPFPGSRRARVARFLAIVATLLSLFAALAAASAA